MPTENQMKLATIAHQWGGTNYRHGISGPVKGVMLTFEQLENFARALALMHSSGEPPVPKSLPSIVLNANQLAQALEFVAPDYPADKDQAETEVCIQELPDGIYIDGTKRPAGVYCWIYEYPGEGSIPLEREIIMPTPATEQRG